MKNCEVHEIFNRKKKIERNAAETDRKVIKEGMARKKILASLNVNYENTDNVFMAMCSFKRYTLLLMFS
jgi:hypothetical protein